MLEANSISVNVLSNVAEAGWEQQLLAKALTPRRFGSKGGSAPAAPQALAAAYARCQELTRANSHTFYLTSSLLGADQRRASQALYAFCRVSDDIVDLEGQNKLQRLQEWRKRSLLPAAATNDPTLAAWADTRARFGIPTRFADQLLDGLRMDLTKTRYANFEALAHYCYGVASTVGLMTMHIIGYDDEAAVPYAIKLGVALQLTNILRDVGEDWRNGRIYLPQDELAAFGLDETAFAAGQVTEAWRAFMRYQLARVRRLYHESLPGLYRLNRRGRFAIAASAELYRAILNAIEDNDYDVFNQRAFISGPDKLSRLPGIWLRSSFPLHREVA
jgi:phytoene synthase